MKLRLFPQKEKKYTVYFTDGTTMKINQYQLNILFNGISLTPGQEVKINKHHVFVNGTNTVKYINLDEVTHIK